MGFDPAADPAGIRVIIHGKKKDCAGPGCDFRAENAVLAQKTGKHKRPNDAADDFCDTGKITPTQVA